MTDGNIVAEKYRGGRTIRDQGLYKHFALLWDRIERKEEIKWEQWKPVVKVSLEEAMYWRRYMESGVPVFLGDLHDRLRSAAKSMQREDHVLLMREIVPLGKLRDLVDRALRVDIGGSH